MESTTIKQIARELKVMSLTLVSCPWCFNILLFLLSAGLLRGSTGIYFSWKSTWGAKAFWKFAFFTWTTMLGKISIDR